MFFFSQQMKRVTATPSFIWARRVFSTSTGFFAAFVSDVGFILLMTALSSGMQSQRR